MRDGERGARGREKKSMEWNNNKSRGVDTHLKTQGGGVSPPRFAKEKLAKKPSETHFNGSC